jgi:hypothetical protein
MSPSPYPTATLQVVFLFRTLASFASVSHFLALQLTITSTELPLLKNVTSTSTNSVTLIFITIMDHCLGRETGNKMIEGVLPPAKTEQLEGTANANSKKAFDSPSQLTPTAHSNTESVAVTFSPHKLLRLEFLPVDLLRNIFPYCTEINLLKSSPVLGEKLASKDIYKSFSGNIWVRIN